MHKTIEANSVYAFFPAPATFTCSCVKSKNCSVTYFEIILMFSLKMLMAKFIAKKCLKNHSLKIDIHAVILIPHGTKIDMKILI